LAEAENADTISQMLKAARVGLRLGARIAPLVAIACVLSAPIASSQRRPIAVQAPIAEPPTFDSNALAAALPSVLSPPSLLPGSRLVSMIAEDIDADGDLDVVANDGSLNLIVWTNDGSGRLSRQHSRESDGGLRSEPSVPGVAGDFAQPDTAVPSAFGSLLVEPRVRSAADTRAPLSRPNDDDRSSSAFCSTRTPRGPPALDVLM
jgi:hypothetical protein